MSQIIVAPYDLNWAQAFATEAAHIQQALDDNCMAIHHIGSTAVPNLSAKPIIDIIAVLKDQLNCVDVLESIGYQYKGEYNLPFRYYFSKKSDLQFHLHAYPEHNVEIELNLLFRDYLRSNPGIAKDYENLKLRLAEQASSHQKNQSMFTGYTLGKYNFIQNVFQQAGFTGLRLLHCSHPLEWQAIRQLRNRYFFESLESDDPYTWTSDHIQHVHLILYKGIKIIGYAHIQLWPDARAALRIIIIDESFRSKDYGQYLLLQCENWLRNQSIKSLHVESRPETTAFYIKNGYIKMLFNDPDGYKNDPHDVALAKLL